MATKRWFSAVLSTTFWAGSAGTAAANPIGGLQQNWGAAILFFLMLVGVYEAVVILIEAGVYRFALKLAYGKALLFSTVANVASFLVGLIAMRAFGGIANGFPGRFVIAVVVEVPILYILMLSRIRGDGALGRRVILAGIGANVLTHSLTFLLLRGF